MVSNSDSPRAVKGAASLPVGLPGWITHPLRRKGSRRFRVPYLDRAHPESVASSPQPSRTDRLVIVIDVTHRGDRVCDARRTGCVSRCRHLRRPFHVVSSPTGFIGRFAPYGLAGNRSASTIPEDGTFGGSGFGSVSSMGASLAASPFVNDGFPASNRTPLSHSLFILFRQIY